MRKKLNIPSKSTLGKIYSTFANLYGMINWKDAFIIIKKFFPDFTKKDFIKDLKNRADKFSIQYQVYIVKGEKSSYVIGKHFFDEDEMTHLFESQGSFPFWIPDTLDEYLIYSNSKFCQNPNEAKELLVWFDNYVPFSNDKKWLWLHDIYIDICQEFNFEDTLKHLSFHGLYIASKELEFTKLYSNFANNIKLARYRGHSINELTKSFINSKLVELPKAEAYTKPKLDDESLDSQDIIWIRQWLQKKERLNECYFNIKTYYGWYYIFCTYFFI